jgi:hypothetical protein
LVDPSLRTLSNLVSCSPQGRQDDLCVPDQTTQSKCTAASLEEDVPIRNVLANPPQEITSPLATEAADCRGPVPTRPRQSRYRVK